MSAQGVTARQPPPRIAVIGAIAARTEALAEHLRETYEPLGTAPDAAVDRADVVVIEARRCNQSLLDLVTETSRRDSGVRVVVVCERIGASDSRMLLVAGAAGLVLARHAVRTLVPTIEAVHAGQVCLPPRHAGTAQAPGLSARERQVVGLVAMGLSNREIAARLFLAESTVKSHLSSAFGKLGVRTRSQAVDLIVDPAYGLSSGILSLGAAPVQPLSSEEER